jgi:hypothetical protein
MGQTIQPFATAEKGLPMRLEDHPGGRNQRSKGKTAGPHGIPAARFLFLNPRAEFRTPGLKEAVR